MNDFNEHKGQYVYVYASHETCYAEAPGVFGVRCMRPCGHPDDHIATSHDVPGGGWAEFVWARGSEPGISKGSGRMCAMACPVHSDSYCINNEKHSPTLGHQCPKWRANAAGMEPYDPEHAEVPGWYALPF